MNQQDNPFAKGVSINQDIVQEPEMVPMIGLAVPDNLKRYHELGVQMSEDAAGLMGVGETPRIRCVDYDPANEDRYNASLYANHPTLNRELLALGREEE